MLADTGGSNARMFGSVAWVRDRPDSEIDLLVDFAEPQSLVMLGRLEAQIGELIDATVDFVTGDALKPHILDSAMEEAVAL